MNLSQQEDNYNVLTNSNLDENMRSYKTYDMFWHDPNRPSGPMNLKVEFPDNYTCYQVIEYMIPLINNTLKENHESRYCNLN